MESMIAPVPFWLAAGLGALARRLPGAAAWSPRADLAAVLPALSGALWGQSRSAVDVDGVWQGWASLLQAPYELDPLLEAVLASLAAAVAADGYYAYAAAARGLPLRLRTIRTTSGAPVVGPDYAGVVSGAPAPTVPLQMAPPAPDDRCAVERVAGQPALFCACGPQLVLRAIGGDCRRLRAPDLEVWRRLGARLRPVAEMSLHIEELRRGLEAESLPPLVPAVAAPVVASPPGSGSGPGLAERLDSVMAMICQAGAELLAASAAYLVTWPGEGADHRPERLWSHGDAASLLAALDPCGVGDRLDRAQVVAWFAPDLPASVARLGMEAYFFISLGVQDGRRGALVFGCVRSVTGRMALREVSRILGESLCLVLRERAQARRVGAGYVHLLLRVCDLLDAADPDRPAHSYRVAGLAARLGAALDLPPAARAAAELAGRLHDLGMAAADPAIAAKPAMPESERQLIRQHSRLGADLLVGLPPAVLPPDVERAVRHHHEHWDGSGYPDGLAGPAIPVEARVVAAAEQLLARITPRGYRPAQTLPEALAALQALAGRELDPAVVAALVRLAEANDLAGPATAGGR